MLALPLVLMLATPASVTPHTAEPVACYGITVTVDNLPYGEQTVVVCPRSSFAG